MLQQAHAVQVRAFEETGKYEGHSGVALARTMFSLAKCYREMLKCRNDSESNFLVVSSSSRRVDERDDFKLQAAAEHALTVCLYLQTTLLGVHVDTLNSYSEIADFFYTQRRCVCLVTYTLLLKLVVVYTGSFCARFGS